MSDKSKWEVFLKEMGIEYVEEPQWFGVLFKIREKYIQSCGHCRSIAIEFDDNGKFIDFLPYGWD